MPPNGSVFQRVRRQIELETSAAAVDSSGRRPVRIKGILSSGELVWVSPSDVRSHEKEKVFRFARGEKYVLTKEEAQSLTPYEFGYCEYIYEGQLKRLKKMRVQTDPRHAIREGTGTLFYPNGTFYEGKWYDNKRHGVGCISSQKGFTYTGEWKNDVPNGNGYETFACQAAIDAHYVNGNPEGDGTIMYNPRLNTYRYEGQWREGRRHGKGVIFYPNGDTFACTFERGRRNGRGVTTQIVNGKVIQYETQWMDDKLVGKPRLIPRALYTKKHISFLPYRMKGYLTAADILNWRVNEEAFDLSFDHFIQLKLGFESLDVVGCGLLPLKELRAVWPKNNMNMLHKLESGGKGCVELRDILYAWYPNVPIHNIARLMQEFIFPFDLLRLRGFLNGIEDMDGKGYYQVCGKFTCTSTQEKDQQPSLQIQDLEASEYRIGGEEFTLTNYTAACQLRNPPRLLDVLEVLYPNILRVTLEHYEMEEIDTVIVDAIRVDFNRYAHSDSSCGNYLVIDEFVQAEATYREHLYAFYQKHELMRNSTRLLSPSSQTTIQQHVLLQANNPIEADMRQGFFKGTAMWVLGNRIHINIPLLLAIENFYVRQKGRVSFDELLRFCFPNVPCLVTQEIFLGQWSQTPCRCELCKSTME